MNKFLAGGGTGNFTARRLKLPGMWLPPGQLQAAWRPARNMTASDLPSPAASGNFAAMDHASLHSHYLTTRARSRALFGRLAPEAMDMRPIPLRLQFRFYEGHLANFNLRMMLFAKQVAADPNPHYSIVFDRGIDPLDAANADPDKIRAAYPPRSEVREYAEMVEEKSAC